jgi:hypothetical protein
VPFGRRDATAGADVQKKFLLGLPGVRTCDGEDEEATVHRLWD